MSERKSSIKTEIQNETQKILGDNFTVIETQKMEENLPQEDIESPPRNVKPNLEVFKSPEQTISLGKKIFFFPKINFS